MYAHLNLLIASIPSLIQAIIPAISHEQINKLVIT